MDIFGLFSISIWTILLVLVFGLLYKYSTQNHDVFTNQGVKGPRPYPLVGTAHTFFIDGIRQMMLNNFKLYGNIVGTFIGTRPNFYISDDELLREIMVKNFDSFTNRSPLFKSDKLGKHFLTMLEDEDWKRVRNTSTPTFTTGKLKAMVGAINDVSNRLCTNIEEFAQSEKPFDVRELAGAYTMDAIARTGFNVDIDSQKDLDNVFLKNAKQIFNFSIFNPRFAVSILIPWAVPFLSKFGYSVFPPENIAFFKKMMDDIMKEREKGSTSKTVRQRDFIQLLLDAHKLEDVDEEEVKKEVAELGAEYDSKLAARKKGLSTDEVMEQAILFFLAGYDTTANGLAGLLYNMAVHPEWQEKVYQEIVNEIGDEEADIDYNVISKLKTLDNCFQESLRMFPPLILFDRVCKRDITIRNVHFPANSVVNVPVIAIHHDPTKWPEPEVFNPDRFLPEERAKRNPFHFLPFGYGPRNCIGMRLALMEALIGAAKALRKFKFVTTSDTQIPLKFHKFSITKTERGVWIKAEKRD